jgi:benzoate-CoA ligase family protein
VADIELPVFPEAFNLAAYFLDERIAEGKGERVALITAEDDRHVTYRELQALANQVAALLVDEGVMPEDRVLIALPDGLAFAAAFFGVLKAGAVVTMVNPELPVADYTYYLGYTKARAFLCAAELRARLDGGEFSKTCRSCWTDRSLLEEAARKPTTFVNAPTTRDDLAIWLFTSGSTGKPKAAVHMHHDFAYNTELYPRRVLGMTEHDITLSVPKLFFGYATGMTLMFPLRFGGTAVTFPERPTAARLFELIEKYRPTILTQVPTMIGKMLAEPGAAGRDLSSLRLSVSAGEALPPELLARWQDTFHSEILDGIGSAELFHIYISNYPGDVRPGSLGKLVPGYQARIVDDAGNDVAAGDLGALMVRGDSAALCYWAAHEASKATFSGDWVRSADKFKRDADGYFYYGGRADDLLKVGGIFVAPTEIEAVLMEHDGVLECVVVGYDEAGLTKHKAVVVPRSGWAPDLTLEGALIAHARRRLVAYKVPRKIEFSVGLPRNDRGKISRREVK